MKQYGITLIELMIAVAIVGILTMIAYPSYQAYVLHSHRSEAQAALTHLANLEEQYFMDNNTYGSLYQIGAISSSTGTSYTTENSYYSVTLDHTTSTFTLKATAINQQTADTGCTDLTLTETGTKGSDGDETTCWK